MKAPGWASELKLRFRQTEADRTRTLNGAVERSWDRNAVGPSQPRASLPRIRLMRQSRL